MKKYETNVAILTDSAIAQVVTINRRGDVIFLPGGLVASKADLEDLVGVTYLASRAGNSLLAKGAMDYPEKMVKEIRRTRARNLIRRP